VHGSVSGVLSDGTPVVVRTAAPDSHALKWFVMALAVVVFLYAGFLVWQLLQSTPPSERVERSPAAEPVVTESDGVNARKTDDPPDAARPAPERKNSTTAQRPRRRRARPKSQRAGRPISEPAKLEKEARPPAPEADPVDIDIQNPYRN
jgi:cytoskeletal protein RodZ